MVTAQTTTQIVEQRDHTRKNLPEMNAAGAGAVGKPKRDKNKCKDPRTEARMETETNHHPPLH